MRGRRDRRPTRPRTRDVNNFASNRRAESLNASSVLCLVLAFALIAQYARPLGAKAQDKPEVSAEIKAARERRTKEREARAKEREARRKAEADEAARTPKVTPEPPGGIPPAPTPGGTPSG